MSTVLSFLALYSYLRPRKRERVGRHRTGVSALSVVARLCSERDEDMPTSQPAQHSRSRLWD